MKTIAPRGFGQKERYLWMVDVNAMFAEIEADLESIKDYQKYHRERDGVIGGTFTLGVGTDDTTKVRMSGSVRYRIDGVEYTAQDQEVDLIGTDDITHNTNGAWRIMINKLGVLSTQRATTNGTSGVMAYASAETALLCLSQIARTTATVDVGYLMIHATNAAGGFTPQTDDPATSDAQVDVATYYNVRMPRIDNGLTATPSVGLSEGTNDDEYAWGTIDARTNGLNKAQIAADTSQAFSQNDTIGAVGQYGGHLFITDTAGTGIISIAATGIAGSVQAMSYTSQALVTAALDAVQLALPQIYTVIGRETTIRIKVASFAYNTDDLAGTDGTATWTDEVSGDFARGTMSGTGVKIDPPAIPAATAATTLAFSGL